MEIMNFIELQTWVDSKLSDISKKLPTLVHDDPASFACGFNAGYKQALLEIDRIIAKRNDAYTDAF